MAACGSAAGLVAVLWVDHGLNPSETLDAPPGVYQAAVGLLHARGEQRRQAEEQRARDEDLKAAAQMRAVLGDPV